MSKQYDNISLKPVKILTDQLNAYSTDTRKWQGIPGICWAGGDTMYATWYSGGITEGPDNYVLVVRSEDAGQSWTEPIVVIDPPDKGIRAFDSTLWCDPLGRVWLFWAQGYSPADEKIWDGRAGVWASICENPLGKVPSWSVPRRIEDGIMLNKPCVCKNGDWLLPISIWREEPLHPAVQGRRSAGVAITCDQGQSFQWLGGAQIPECIFDEHHVFEKCDGNLALWSRTLNGIAESLSTDKGKTWSEGKKNGIECPNSRFFITRLANDVLLMVNHHEARDETTSYTNNRQIWLGRNNLAAMISYDDGKTWQNHSIIDPRQGVSYPDGDINEDGRIAVIYDYNRYDQASIYLAVFMLDDLISGKEIVSWKINALS